MGLVAHEREGARLHRVEHPSSEPGVGQSFGCDQEQVDLVAADALFHLSPGVDVGRVDGDGDETEAFGGRDLVAHQCQER